jgi:hypothetical protein
MVASMNREYQGRPVQVVQQVHNFYAMLVLKIQSCDEFTRDEETKL